MQTNGLTPPPTCTTLTALLRFPLAHTARCPVPSASSPSSAPSSTCSASLPHACLYLPSASPNSLQAYTHCQLFLLLSHCDLTGEHSCPATIPPRTLFCFRPFPLSSSTTTLLPFPAFLFFVLPLLSKCRIPLFLQVSSVSPICSSSDSLPPQERELSASDRDAAPPGIATLLKLIVFRCPNDPGICVVWDNLVGSPTEQLVPGELPDKDELFDAYRAA